MAENTLNAILKINTKTYSAWQSDSRILRYGEPAIAEIPSETSGSGMSPPAFALKIGDGQNQFKNLKWIQSIAGDVPTWAKTPNLKDALLTGFTKTSDSGEITASDSIAKALSKLANNIASVSEQAASSHTHANKTVLDNTTASFTTGLKTNYDSAYNHSTSAHAPSGAQANVIESVKVNNTALTPSSKAVNVSIKGSGATSVSTDSSGGITISSTDTNTNTTYDLAATTSSSNGNAKIQLKGNNSITDSVTIKGTGATSVTTDSSGNIIVNSTDTNTDTNTTYDLVGTTSSTNGNAKIQLKGTNNTTDAITVSGTGATKVTTDSSGNIIINSTDTNTDTNTTYDLAASKSSSNGNVKMNLTGSNSTTDSVTITGSGATKVTTDSNGVITINSTDNNTTYGAAGANLGLVKTGGDVTISNGQITVNDNSHGHSIDNVSGLQNTLNGKLPITGGTINGNLRLQSSGTTYGNILYFGDGSNACISESSENNLYMYGNKGLRLYSQTGEITLEAEKAIHIVSSGDKIRFNSDQGIYGKNSGKKIVRAAATLVVGTTESGHTYSDCDYLCDGTADQVEINNAINALPAGGGKVVLLEGTYNLSGTITIGKSNVTLAGMGRSTVLNRAFNGGLISISANDITCENFCITGNKSTYATDGTTKGITMSVTNNMRLIFKNLTLNNEHWGISLDYSQYSLVEGCIFTDCATAINGGGSKHCIITGNRIANPTKYAILTDWGAQYDLISNNVITGAATGIMLEKNSNANYHTIMNNRIIDAQVGIDVASSCNSIHGNYIIHGTGQTSNYSTSQYTIRILSGGTYNDVSDNFIIGKTYTNSGGSTNTFNNNKS